MKKKGKGNSGGAGAGKPSRRLALANRKPKPKAKAKPQGGKRASPGGGDLFEDNREIAGLILLSAVLVTFIALIADFVQSGGNILGPYLGAWWAGLLNSALGKLPVLIYLAALALLGAQWLFDRAGWRAVTITGATGFLFGLLLSVHNMGSDHLTGYDFQVSGGWVGNFLAQQIFLPVFGPTVFGPYLVTGLLILVLVAWGFQLSVAAWLTRGANVAGALGRSLADGWIRAGKTGREREKAAEFQQPLPVPASRALRDAARRRRNDDLIPTEDDSPEEEKAKLEALLDSGDLENLDPLTIRKLRDIALERQRVTELNDWEEKTRNTEIGGLLKRASMPPLPPGLNGDVLDDAPALPDEETAEAGELDPFGSPDGDDGLGDPPRKPRKVARTAPSKSPSPRFARAADGDGEVSGEEGADPAPRIQYDPYRLPELDDLFPDPPDQPLEFTEQELLEQKQLLEAQLNNFKVRSKVSGIHPGPIITRYEVELAPGEKVNRISGLADDLALALRAKSIRILAPIPGKSLVGVEVPNRRAQMVYIKEILSSPEFGIEDDTLKIAVGKTIAGDPYVADLTRAPHLLIAGQTGSGKSVCINSIMASLLVSKSPDELRMILIDPKVVELKPYEKIPHLLGPVITQPEAAVQALKWATVKMDERYGVLARAGVRNIKGYNQKVRDGSLPGEVRYNQFREFGDAAATPPEGDDATIMPFVLIVIDELADLMMVAGKEVETNIARIAQKARAVGIHLILATQRPSTNVITGTIKANLPTRMAFQVASQVDARTILDRQGAEKLLGRGDMLYRPIEFPEPVRLHGCFIDDAQCEEVAGACSEQFVNYPQVKSFNVEEEMDGGDGGDEERDARFADAAELVVQLKQASVSLLQRRLGLGYARSGRLVDQLERAGIVGRERGSKPREVLMNEEELHSFLRSHEATEGL